MGNSGSYPRACPAGCPQFINTVCDSKNPQIMGRAYQVYTLLERKYVQLRTLKIVHSSIQSFYLIGHNFMNNFTILIPCYNEARTIGTLLNQLIKLYPEIPVVVIDNNSTDSSLSIIQSFKVAVVQEITLGKARAVRAGLTVVQTPYVILLDADLEYDAEYISVLMSNVVVYGMYVGVRPKKLMLWSSRLANSIIRFILWLRFKKNINDCLSGLRIVPTEILRMSTSHGFELETELNKLCLKRELDIYSISVKYTPRIIGKKIKPRDMLKLMGMALS